MLRSDAPCYGLCVPCSTETGATATSSNVHVRATQLRQAAWGAFWSVQTVAPEEDKQAKKKKKRRQTGRRASVRYYSKMAAICYALLALDFLAVARNFFNWAGKALH